MKTDEKLRANEKRFHSLITNSPDFIFITDADGKVKFINRTLPQHTEKDIIGKTVYDFALPEYHSIIKTTIAKVFAEGLPNRYESKAPGPNGFIAYYETRCIPLMEDGNVLEVIGVSTDISVRKRAEEALRESEEKWRSLAENAPVMITHVDREGFIKSINRVPEDIGMTEDAILGRSAIDFVDEQYKDSVREVYVRVFDTGISESHEIMGAFTKRWYHSTVGALKKDDEVIGLTVINVDITESKRAEEARLKLERRVQQAQKLESLGVLAGGIAHDFNNLLMGVMGNANLALLKMTKEAPCREYVCNIQTASEMAADLARQMLAYSGKGQFIIEPVDLRSLVNEMAHLLETSISKKAVIRYDLSDNVPVVEADLSQIRQIIINLVINASEAIEDRSGVISIRTGTLECGRAFLSETYLENDLPEGVYSYLEVSDTGRGMDQETIGRIFDPFFTTKFIGRGLGLAAVLGIVRGHKGAIKVYSEPGKGTSFKVLFPAIEGQSSAPKESSDYQPDTRLEGKTVLLVDDEKTVRRVGSELLSAIGLEVVTAENGKEALSLFKETPDKFDVIILDLTMPYMNGEETLREMRRIRKDIRAILSSGYNEQSLVGGFVAKGFAGFIQKPYGLTKIKETLLTALGMDVT